jgi:hypothetical protein
VNSRFNEYAPAVSPDGSALYFASNRPRAGEAIPADDAWEATIRERRDRHDYDVYVAEMVDGIAKEACGVAAINTEDDEGSPAISPGGDFLYFASDRAGGQGGYDLYRIRLINGGTLCDASRWEAENLGPSVNSPANELDPGLSADGFRLHFSSNRGGKGAERLASDAARESQEASGADSRYERRYALWQSVSREVYFEGRPLSAELLALWAKLWPWLALLAASLLIAWMLAKLIRSEVWRRRFARLSLLAQCLILSCMIHALIATGLAAWEVGQGVIDMVSGGEGGGTQVILSSSSGLGDAGGMAMGQITSSAIEIPAGMGGDAMPESVAAEIQSSMGSQMASVLPDAMLMPLMSVVGTSDAKMSDAGPAVTQVVQPGATDFSESAQVPEMARVAAVKEQAAGRVEVAGEREIAVPALNAVIAGSSKESMQLAPMVVEGSPASIGVAEASGESKGAAGLRAMPAEEVGEVGAVPAMATKVTASEKNAAELASDPVSGPGGSIGAATTAGTPVAIDATRPAIGKFEGVDGAAANVPQVGDARVTDKAEMSSAVREMAGAASQNPVQTAVPAPIAARAGREEPVRGASSEVASESGVERGGVMVGNDGAKVNRAEVAAPEMRIGAGSVGTSGGEIAGKDAVVREGASRVQNAGEIATAAGSGVDARLPSVAGPSVPSKGEAKAGSIAAGGSELQGIGAGSRDLLKVQGAGPEIAKGSGPVLGKLDTGGADVGRGVAGLVKEAAVQQSAGRDRAAAAPRMESAGTDGARGLRLPEIPTEQVDPLETFAQRAPEVRSELLERMGGSRETEAAVGRALAWMARHQSADGRWSARGFDDDCGSCDEPATVDADVAMTGMALLCYLGAGHTHMDEGPYREHVRKGIEWLLARQNAAGDMRGRETMYGQTVATVALCEALSMTGDERLKAPAKRAADFVVGVAARPRAAGTQVRPEDTSVIGWLVMTVESARRAGIPVPPSVYVSAAKWLDQVSVPGQEGLYAYRAGEKPSIAMTAEAMFVQQILGRKRDEARMRESAAYLLREPPAWRDGAPTHSWYYATLALFEQQGEEWSTWNDAMRKELLRGQRRDGGADGSWDPQDEWARLGGRIYQTAVCTLCLEVYYRYAPSEGEQGATGGRGNAGGTGAAAKSGAGESGAGLSGRP